MSTPLADKIKALIRSQGPIGIADYFALCLSDPEHGYYRHRDPFGRDGDFVTAPEISQLFGEMVAVFVIHAWQRHGSPKAVRLIEMGPGRGTMMADMLRVIARAAPKLLDALNVHLVETSPRLRSVQAQTLARFAERIGWHDDLAQVPQGFSLIVANELFDAIPIRQFVMTQSGFRERLVGLGEDGALVFAAGAGTLDPAWLPDRSAPTTPGTVFEIAPARQALMQIICERLAAQRGTALIIDYGHLVTGFGDSLQAVRNHDFDPVLAHPGEADLTSHVDFEDLARTALETGLHVNGSIRQGDFLFGLGLAERARALAANKDADTQQAIAIAVDRLAGEGAGKMGALFKVLAVSHPAMALLPFRSGD